MSTWAFWEGPAIGSEYANSSFISDQLRFFAPFNIFNLFLREGISHKGIWKGKYFWQF